MFDVPKKLRHAGTDSRITIGFRLATLPLHELRGPSGIRKRFSISVLPYIAIPLARKF